MKPLLSASQLGSIQRVAESSMQVDVTIKRPVFGSDDLGDGAFDEDPIEIVTVKGYLRHTGGDTTGDVDGGSVVTTSTFELGIPIGTDVKTRDIAVIADREYFVQDVRDDETWPAMLNCLLRRRE